MTITTLTELALRKTAQAQTRVQSAVQRWKDALETVTSAEQLAGFQIQLPETLLDIKETDEKLQTATYLELLEIERQVDLKGAEVLDVADRTLMAVTSLQHQLSTIKHEYGAKLAAIPRKPPTLTSFLRQVAGLVGVKSQEQAPQYSGEYQRLMTERDERVSALEASMPRADLNLQKMQQALALVEAARNKLIEAARNKTDNKVVMLDGYGVTKITVVHPGPNSINAVKLVRENTGLGLKEAKDFVDGAPFPLDVAAKQGASQMAHLIAELRAMGATVQVE